MRQFNHYNQSDWNLAITQYTLHAFINLPEFMPKFMSHVMVLCSQRTLGKDQKQCRFVCKQCCLPGSCSYTILPCPQVLASGRST